MCPPPFFQCEAGLTRCRNTRSEILESRRRLSDLSSPSAQPPTSAPILPKLVRRSFSCEKGELTPLATVAKGAKALIKEADFPLAKEGTTYLAPQVLVDVDHSMRVMMEESFGPVVGIMKVRSLLSSHRTSVEYWLCRSSSDPLEQVKDDAEALKLINDSPYGLTASVWTKDEEAFGKLVDEIETGTVFMNRCVLLPSLWWRGTDAFSRCRCDYLDPALPWTGFKDSGRGISLSRYGFDAVTRAKSVHVRAI